MKKVFLFVITMLPMMAVAQIDSLTRYEVKGDPMLGGEGYTAWVGKNIHITEKANGKTTITLTNDGLQHVFVKGATIIGYYSKDGEFLYKTESYTTQIEQGSQKEYLSAAFSKDSVPYSEYSKNGWVLPNMWRVLPSDIMRWLRETGGHIRIVAPMYGGNRLDFKFAIKKEE